MPKTEFHIALSPLTHKIYAGQVRVNGTHMSSAGHRHDVTNDFLSCVIQYAEAKGGAYEICSSKGNWDVTVTKRPEPKSSYAMQVVNGRLTGWAAEPPDYIKKMINSLDAPEKPIPVEVVSQDEVPQASAKHLSTESQDLYKQALEAGEVEACDYMAFLVGAGWALQGVHAKTEKLKAELVRESHRTAEHILRAQQLENQHRMQCNIRQDLERQIEAMKGQP